MRKQREEMMQLQMSKQRKDQLTLENQEKEQRITYLRNALGLRKDFGKTKDR